MSTPKSLLAAAVTLLLSAASAFADTPKLGTPLTEQDIAPWDITVFPDGTGLPPGSGSPAQGAAIYVSKCIACHAEGAKGGGAPGATALVGGAPLTSGIDVTKTIGNFFGYSTTVFDYIRRGMPFNMPQTLTNDEVYALTAYILSLNKIIGESDVMDAMTLPAVKMPNRDGFIIRFPDRI
jgi:S-disulfanyl-L-cysteine oxidoreductase SoxD